MRPSSPHSQGTDTPEARAKRAERAKKRAERETPEARAAAAAAAKAEADAKRERRRQRDADEAEALRRWAIREGAGHPALPLVDIGANLTKVKTADALACQLQRCAASGVRTVVCTGTSVVGSRRALDLAKSVSSDAGVRVFSTAGVHPHDARTCDEHTLDALAELLAAPECVAVGETGLDYDRMFSKREVQLRWFERQAALAAARDMPLFVHERDLDPGKGPPLGSHEDLLTILDRTGVRPERVCVHCFTGSAEHLRDYISRGYFIGLTGFVAMRQRGAHVRQALRDGAVPLGQLMVETDAPFMRPDREYLPDVKSLQRGQCEPCFVPAVVAAVAELTGVPPAEVARVTTANAQAFFRLPDAS